MTKDELARENAALRKRLDALEARLAALEARPAAPVVVLPRPAPAVPYDGPYYPAPYGGQRCSSCGAIIRGVHVCCGSVVSMRTDAKVTTT